ncbi:MAG: glycosyltransferase [Bacteroidetes bacterium]|nr:glycosyltransferase [Bacteroidota bacterium]MBS1539381.1 glycosyltransferase [Bacteroidota bacterium]
MKKLTSILAFIVMIVTVNAQQMNHSQMKNPSSASKLVKDAKYHELNKAMRELWSAHMYWTLITVDAYYNDPKGLSAKLDRLLQNQKDIGAAIVPFYGQAAGDQLAKLLTEHIQGAVPVLKAAKENNKEALDKAVKDWYANAKEIGSFLASANPKNWAEKDTEGALEMHITHTIAYSVSILKGDYSQSFGGFEEALHHMLQLADILTDGLVKQFPEKFKN